MPITYYNANRGVYEVELESGCREVCILNYDEFYEKDNFCSEKIKFRKPKTVLSGFVVDALAKYENTGLTPEEIRELQISEKNVGLYNKMLRKDNDDCRAKYQKLLDENNNLKALLRNYLNSIEMVDAKTNDEQQKAETTRY